MSPAPLLSSWPTPLVEIAFATDPGAVPTWVDVTSYCTGFSTRRGRGHELERVQAGTATVRLDNSDRRFDPAYTAGPYYPNVVPMRRLRISATWLGVTYRLFTGYVERWPNKRKGPKRSYIDVEAVDAFEVLANTLITATYGAGSSSSHISSRLDTAGWAAADRSIGSGQSQIQGSTLDDATLLDELQLVAESENGLLFVSGDGKVTFQGRWYRLNNFATSSGTFSDTSGSLRYRDLEITYDGREIRNDIAVERVGGGEQRRSDAASITRYLKRSYKRQPLLTTDTEAADMAQWLLSRFKDPQLRVQRLELSPRMDDALWPHALGRELGERITVAYNPPPAGSPVVSKDVHIDGIAHDVGKSGESWAWRTEWLTTPADLQSYWVLDSATLSVLDSTTRPAY